MNDWTRLVHTRMNVQKILNEMFENEKYGIEQFCFPHIAKVQSIKGLVNQATTRNTAFLIHQDTVSNDAKKFLNEL